MSCVVFSAGFLELTAEHALIEVDASELVVVLELRKRRVREHFSVILAPLDRKLRTLGAADGALECHVLAQSHRDLAQAGDTCSQRVGSLDRIGQCAISARNTEHTLD